MKILKTVIFEPQPDITVLELATIIANLSGPYVQLCDESLLSLFLGTELKRHFSDNDERPKGGSIFAPTGGPKI